MDTIHLNDLNPGIAAFWRSVTTHPTKFCDLIENTPADLEQWHKARATYLNPTNADDLTLGFATFFLNRTNRSGILHARTIGGLEQTGQWKIDARFNKTGLIKRVQWIGEHAEHIHITQLDGLKFLETLSFLGDQVFVYADPPYIVQGNGLYLHTFDDIAHLSLAEALSTLDAPWILTYDDAPRITDILYKNVRRARFPIAHTAHKQHVGTEAVIYCEKLNVADLELTTGRIAQWV